MEEKFKYSEAIAELNSIVQEMQSDRCSIDELSAKTARALKLIEQCKARLTETDADIARLFAQIDEDK